MGENFDQVKWVDHMIQLATDKYKADWIINVEDSDDGIVDNRLHDFIKNAYKNIDYFLANKHYIFNNKTRRKCKNKYEKIAISCQRRINEIKKLLGIKN